MSDYEKLIWNFLYLKMFHHNIQEHKALNTTKYDT